MCECRSDGDEDGNENESTQIHDSPTFVHCERHMEFRRKRRKDKLLADLLSLHQTIAKAKSGITPLHSDCPITDTNNSIHGSQMVFNLFSPDLPPSVLLASFVPSIILPMSSSSDVIDLERRAMAGGVSRFACCGAAKGSRPNADLMFSILV